MECKILIAGTGGQGILLAGKLLAMAGLLEQREVTWFPAYGAEMRSGVAHCSVVISDQFIGSPITKTYDAVIAMSPQSCSAFLPHVLPGGVMIVDADLVPEAPAKKDITLLSIPSLRLAAEMGSQRTANVLLAGALAGITGCASLASLQEALASLGAHLNPDLLRLNKTVLEKGYSDYANQKSAHC